MESAFREICNFDINLYKCISEQIDTSRVVLTDKSMIHIESNHPEAYEDIMNLLEETILCPDYIIRDEKHEETGLVIKRISTDNNSSDNSIIVVLKVCTDSCDGLYANSVLSAWKISIKRLQNYLRNKEVLYSRY